MAPASTGHRPGATVNERGSRHEAHRPPCRTPRRRAHAPQRPRRAL